LKKVFILGALICSFNLFAAWKSSPYV